MPSYASASDSKTDTVTIYYDEPAVSLTPPETAALIEELRACDKALRDSQTEVAKKDYVTTQMGHRIAAQDDRVAQLERERDSLLRNPTLWFALGMLATGLTAGLVK